MSLSFAPSGIKNLPISIHMSLNCTQGKKIENTKAMQNDEKHT